MVCQLRPLVYSLGQNNPPRICLTPRKSRVKMYNVSKRGTCRCKMAGAGIRSFAKFRGQMPRIAKTGITSWQTALKWTVDCHAPRSGCQEYMRSGMWQSALKLRPLTVAIRASVILFLAIRGLNATICGTHLSAEHSKRLNSSSRHFTSRVPLFEG
jgi:hypothetical protein